MQRFNMKYFNTADKPCKSYRDDIFTVMSSLQDCRLHPVNVTVSFPADVGEEKDTVLFLSTPAKYKRHNVIFVPPVARQKRHSVILSRPRREEKDTVLFLSRPRRDKKDTVLYVPRPRREEKDTVSLFCRHRNDKDTVLLFRLRRNDKDTMYINPVTPVYMKNYCLIY
jgi:hypothetical protein